MIGQIKVDKDKFDSLLGRLLKQKPEKAQEIKGTPKRREPIEERLPEIGIPLLFTTNESAIELGMRCFDDGTQIFQCERTGPRDEPITFRVKDGQVTFWQPLPAPPARTDKEE